MMIIVRPVFYFAQAVSDFLIISKTALHPESASGGTDFS